MASLEAGASGLEGWRAEHSLQLEHIALPESLVTRVFSKLGVGEDGGQEVMDAGASFTFELDESKQSWGALSLLASRSITACEDVWLVDHVWLFPTAAVALAQLKASEPLRQRLCGLFRLDPDSSSAEDIFACLMFTAHPLKLAVAADDDSPAAGASMLHYVMDEVGSAVQEAGASEGPSFACEPFLTGGRTYSLLWPLTDVGQGQIITRRPTVPSEQFVAQGSDYWERRFEREEKPFDWYAPFEQYRTQLEAMLQDAANLSTVIVTPRMQALVLTYPEEDQPSV